MVLTLTVLPAPVAVMLPAELLIGAVVARFRMPPFVASSRPALTIEPPVPWIESVAALVFASIVPVLFKLRFWYVELLDPIVPLP